MGTVYRRMVVQAKGRRRSLPWLKLLLVLVLGGCSVESKECYEDTGYKVYKRRSRSKSANYFYERKDSFRLGPGHSTVAAEPRNGNVYVSGDYVKGALLYTPSGRLLRQFGQARFSELATDSGGQVLYAADKRNLLMYDARDGELINMTPCTTPPWNISSCQLAVDPFNDVYIGQRYDPELPVPTSNRRIRKMRVRGPGIMSELARWRTGCADPECSNPDWVPDPGAMAATASSVYVLGGNCRVTQLAQMGSTMLWVARVFNATTPERMSMSYKLLCTSIAITHCGDVAVLGWAADPSRSPFFFVSILSPKGELIAERKWCSDEIVQDFAINRRTGDMHLLFNLNPVPRPPNDDLPTELRTFSAGECPQEGKSRDWPPMLKPPKKGR